MPDRRRYEEFVALIRQHTNQILAYIDSLLLNWNDAEDLFQDTCLVLWQKFDEFTLGTNFLAWALRIADHKVMNFLKRKSRRMAFTAALRESLIGEVSSRESQATSVDASLLAGCMERLPPNDRKLVRDCYGNDEPVRCLADAMGRSPQSVHHSLRRIRRWLLDCVQRELRRADVPVPIRDNFMPRDQST